MPQLDIFLVDDDSNDGTSDAIKIQFPNVNIIKGNGNLFWNRGMHLAWGNAINKNDYDFYIWLNDDTVIYDYCIKELLACSELKKHQAIISGIIEINETHDIIYGGTDINKKIIHPNGELNPITNLNGNVVLIPKSVFKILGNLDLKFHHDLGDVDYGYRAKEKNIGIFTTRIPIASGERNDICRVRLNNSTFFKRFKRLYSPLGSNPKIIFYFRRKYFGLKNAIIYYIFLHFLNFIPDFLNKFLFKKRYL